MRSTRAVNGNKKLTRSIVQCAAAAALFAAAVPASKTLLAGIEPFTLAGLLYLGAAIAVLPRGRAVAHIRLSRANLVRVAGVAVFGGILAPVLMLLGLKIAPAASVSLWLNVEVVATALIAIWYFSDHLDGRGWIGVVLIALAGVLLAAPGAFSGFPAAVLVAAACVCWSIDNNLTAVIDELTPPQTTLLKGLVGAAVNLTLGFALGVPPLRVEIAAIGIGVGALSYGASLSLYISASQELGAARTQALFASAPLIGCALSWLTLGEPVRAEQIGAAIMTVVGGLLLFSRHQHEHFHLAVVHTHEHSHDDAHHLHAHDSPVGRHSHEHSHEPIAHVPDLHHRHGHSTK